MADRTVKVTLVAVASGYVQGMRQAQDATKKTSDAAKNAADVQKKAAEEQKSALNSMNTALGTSLIALGAVAGASVALSVKAFADYDERMAQVKSLSHASVADMNDLRDATMRYADEFGVSASQAADAEIELTKAGVGVKDQIGGALTGALTLAAAGQMNVADATTIAASAMTQFHLAGKDVPHIADLLAAGADKALGSVGDLGQGLKFVGPIASSMGISIEQTVGTLALFAQNGILAEQAGTGLRGVLLSLTSPSAQAAGVMKQYGISLYDANGAFIGINGAAQELHDKLGPLDQATRNQALGQIFGNQQITEATILMDGGAKSIDKWSSAVDDQGFAAEQAAGKLDSLNGDVEKLKAAFENDLIKAGTGANDMLRGLTQGATSALDAFGGLPKPLQETALGLAAIVAVGGLGGGALVLALPKVLEFQNSLRVLAASDMPGVSAAAGKMAGGMSAAGNAIGRTATVLTGPWGLAAAGAVAAGVLIANEFKKVDDRAQQLSSTLNQQTGAITKNTRANEAKKLAEDGTFEAARKMGISEKQLTDAILGNGDALDKVKKKVQDYAYQHGIGESVISGFANSAQYKVGQALAEETASLDKSQKSTKEAAEATKEHAKAESDSKGATDQNAAALAALSGTADDASGSIDDLSEKIRDFGKGQLDVNSAERDFQAAIDSVTQSINDNGTSLDITTDAGRSNQQALDSIASSALAAAAAIYTQTGSQDQATAAVQSGRDALIAALGQFGITGQAAQDYADKLGLIPGNIGSLIHIDGADAAVVEANRVKNALASIERNIDVAVNLHGAGNLATTGGLRIANAEGNILDFYARGGFAENHTAQISAGVTRVWAEPETGGEAYIPLAASKRARSLSIWAATGKRLGVQGFADGGITYVSVPPSSGAGAPMVNVSPVVSLEGATLYASMDGVPIKLEIQRQIVANDDARARAAKAG
jgi:TP901 family phage tail tape measure protein